MSKFAPVFYSSSETVALLGACATFKGDILKVESNPIDPIDQARFDAVRDDEGIIIVSNALKSNLSVIELAVIIAHEQGHIDLNHLTLGKGQENASGIIDNVQFELDADAEAAKKHGKSTVLTALKSTIVFIVSDMVSSGKVPEQAREKVMNFVLDSMKPRFDALAA